MKYNVLFIMGVVMLICLVTMGAFAFPVGIPLCAIIGLVYGIKNKNRLFTRWSMVALVFGVAFAIYTLFLIISM